ncbi:MAG TPA: helix-turn-helix domain-containing protein [Nitrospiria bacterium]|jgi:curved DNA-binding protein CbpA|nr:helix-turn-helix domain-containing protein [Nitrospiria bacterium]
MTSPVPEQNYYDLLEVHVSASKEEIQQAYDLACKTFGEQSLASYSLFATEERKALLKRIEEAYRVLVDEHSRREYDQSLPKKPASREAAPPPPPLPAAKIPSRKELEDLLVANQEEGLTGQILEHIRKALGVPLQEIANKTKISITYLQFIEENKYKGLPVEVYLRSYLVQYARVLGFDPKKIADGYLKSWRRWQESNQEPP